MPLTLLDASPIVGQSESLPSANPADHKLALLLTYMHCNVRAVGARDMKNVLLTMQAANGKRSNSVDTQ